MNILLVANYLPDRQASMLRYAAMLERELNRRGHQARVVHPPARLLRLLGPRVPLAKWIAYLDKYVLAGRALSAHAEWADVVHICDHSNAMYLPLFRSRPSVITCHDLMAVFAAQGKYAGVRVGSTGRLLQRWIAANLLRARLVICVSHSTAADLRQLAPREAPLLRVVHNPLNWDFHPVPAEQTDAVLRARGLAQPYLIHVGSNSWYKNRPAVVRIFAELKREAGFAHTRLLMAGKPWDAELRELVRSTGLAEDIAELTEVTDEQLRALYSGAVALLFPSRHEGFGWPILEAQACGAPVITTNRAPMTEVAGGAAILVDPDHPQQAARTILNQMGRRAELQARGLRNVALFSMDQAISGYLDAYTSAIAQQACGA